jgi:cellulose synthase (UDP-forming)
MPYVLLSVIPGAAALLVGDPGAASGFYLFAIFNSALYAALLLIIVVGHLYENGMAARARPGAVFAHALMALLLFLPAVAGAAIRGPYGLEAMAWGNGRVALTQATGLISGAGHSGGRVVKVRLRWLDDDRSTGPE